VAQGGLDRCTQGSLEACSGPPGCRVESCQRGIGFDSTQMIIRVVQSKCRKDRHVMLPSKVLGLLRQWWKARPCRTPAIAPPRQPAAIGDAQHYARLQACHHGENALDLIGAQHRRQLLRLLEVPHLAARSWRRKVTRNSNHTPVMIRLLRCSHRSRSDRAENGALHRALPYRANV
jgi:hypothetical protein